MTQNYPPDPTAIIAGLRAIADQIEAGSYVRPVRPILFRPLVVPEVIHDLLCRFRVRTPQDTVPPVACCAACGLAVPMGEPAPAVDVPRLCVCQIAGWGPGIAHLSGCPDAAAQAPDSSELDDLRIPAPDPAKTVDARDAIARIQAAEPEPAGLATPDDAWELRHAVGSIAAELGASIAGTCRGALASGDPARAVAALNALAERCDEVYADGGSIADISAAVDLVDAALRRTARWTSA